MKRLKATWWYEPNFGDALNPYLLEKLSGQKVEYCPEHRPFFKVELRRFLSNPLHFDMNRLKWPETKKKVIMAVGSMLEHARPNYHIWGTGFLRETGKCAGGTFWAVRGKYTAQKLVEQGFPKCDVYGDPALLLPLVYTAKEKRIIGNNNIGIIPHYLDYNQISSQYKEQKVLNLCTYDVESVIDQILECDYVLSTSLHGVIVAHAYGIPALWIRGRGTGTDDIKFRDYFSSVGIPFYEGRFTLSDFVYLPFDSFPNQVKKVMLPEPILVKKLQEKLLEVAPFPISL